MEVRQLGRDCRKKAAAQRQNGSHFLHGANRPSTAIFAERRLRRAGTKAPAAGTCPRASPDAAHAATAAVQAADAGADTHGRRRRGRGSWDHGPPAPPSGESDRAKRASGAYWGASGAPPFGAGERERIKNIRGRCSMRAGILYSTAAPDIFYSASFARKPGSPVSERREGQLPAETIGQFLPSAWRYPYRCVCIEVQDEMRTFSCCY